MVCEQTNWAINEDLIIVLQLLNVTELDLPILKKVHVNVHDIETFAS